MIRLLGRRSSFNVRKVLWLCDELGLPFTREDWGRGFTPTTTPEFLRLNPAAQIPVVLTDGLVLRESHAILRYLCLRHGAEALYPSDPAKRVFVEQWMDWVAYDLTHAMRGAFLGGQLKEPPWNNPWFVDQGRRDFTHCIGLLERELASGKPYACGDAFTLADIPLGLVVNRWFAVQGFDKPDTPHVSAYFERLSERPAFLAHGRNGLP
ncbi:MAG: glutathione S-transferase family protein [Acetobacteraceae bacterium]|nr:glutathione S-transferase family protein [Acetobacteraceae bacterium]